MDPLRANRTTQVKIAILGTRGIPANYGGFETFAEELGKRLVVHGHSVAVYGRSHHVPKALTSYLGMDLVVLPTIKHKYFDTVIHTALSAFHAAFKRYDIVLICNAANALFAWIPRLSGSKVLINVDGIERNRQKWNTLGRAWYQMSERLSSLLTHGVITDARVIEDYYMTRYGVASTFIPYGCDPVRDSDGVTISGLGLERDGYLLYVSRLEPENNALAVIQGYEMSQVEIPLVIVGDAPYATEYKNKLKQAAGSSVMFTGGLYGNGYRDLQCNALAYIHATEVGGTHPALIEAMGFGNAVLVNGTPENREVAGDPALYFDSTDYTSIAEAIKSVATNHALRDDLRRRAQERASELFSWDTVTNDYETLFVQAIRSGSRSRRTQ